MMIKEAALIIVISICVGVSVKAQQSQKRTRHDMTVIVPNRAYDARIFLSRSQKVKFKRLYPDFDESRAEKNWEYKDVDPLALFSAEENRARRRELFLYEYSPSARNPSEREPTREQLAFRAILSIQFEGAGILMSNATLKMSVPYTEQYEPKKLPSRSLLEKLAQLGLEWTQLGGKNLYVYNGKILMAKYKSGYVSLADLDIDRPTERKGRR